jgi:hypothetical protein
LRQSVAFAGLIPDRPIRFGNIGACRPTRSSR